MNIAASGFWWDRDLSIYLLPTITVGSYDDLQQRRVVAFHWLKSYFLIYIRSNKK